VNSHSKRLLALGATGALVLGIAACGEDDEGGSGGGDLSGTISIDGSSTVQPFAEAAGELFKEENSGVDVTVGAAGTSGGFEKFCAGETDISDASRPIEPEEEKLCQDGGVEYTEVQVANDGIAVVTNPELAISCLTVDQLAQLWEPNSKITNYSQLGEDAETGEALPDVDVSLYGPGTDSGTFDYFTDEVVGEEGASRDDYQPSEDDNVLVQGVSGDTGGLAYFGYSYYEQNQDALNLVSVDAGDGCVDPSLETIQDGSYTPLGRPIFMYPSTEALGRSEVEGFMNFAVDSYTEIAEAANIVPMDATQAEESRTTLDGALGGGGN
jgi:phosphate transport system substrate-binding protein